MELLSILSSISVNAYVIIFIIGSVIMVPLILFNVDLFNKEPLFTTEFDFPDEITIEIVKENPQEKLETSQTSSCTQPLKAEAPSSRDVSRPKEKTGYVPE